MQARTEENGKHGFLNVQFQTGSFMAANCSSEASAPSYSQSASSTVISPASLDVSETPCESSAQSGNPSLKEQDYIGMADMSSTASILSLSEQKLSLHQVNLDHEEPDLRLGLGPSSSKGVGDNAGLHLFAQPSGKNVKESPSISQSRADMPDTKQGVFDAVHAHPHPNSSGAFPMPSLKRLDALHTSSFCPIAGADPQAKSAKRLFSDTVLQAPPEVGISTYVNAGTGVQEAKAGAMFGPGAVRMIMQRADLNSKPLSKQPQMLYWSTPRAPSWPSEFGQSTSPHDQLPRKHTDNPLALKSMLERTSPSGSVVVSNLDTASDEAPPAKEQVIGWPPVRSYRRSAINSGRPRPAGTESDVQAAMYVKVNMDGIPIGRKVDLNAYSSYDELLSALEGLFYSPLVGEGVRFLRARDFVLTYEDKEGDWMLVGDVPWGMFVNTVKRLRITRGSESTCLGSSTSKNFS